MDTFRLTQKALIYSVNLIFFVFSMLKRRVGFGSKFRHILAKCEPHSSAFNIEKAEFF